MFKSCTTLNVAFAWSTPAAISMRDTSQLQSTARTWAFSSSLVLTDTSNMIDMSEMFAGASALRRTVRLDMSRVTLGARHDCPDEAHAGLTKSFFGSLFSFVGGLDRVRERDEERQDQPDDENPARLIRDGRRDARIRFCLDARRDRWR